MALMEKEEKLEATYDKAQMVADMCTSRGGRLTLLVRTNTYGLVKSGIS